MIKIQRTDSSHPDFATLVVQLDAYLEVVDGDDHAFYDQYNKIDNIRYVVLAYLENQAVGCGSIKKYDDHTVELKRMFTTEGARGKGVASAILSELENWAAELGFQKCILETGMGQVEAVSFYKKHLYVKIPNFGPYEGIDNSVCFEKRLSLNTKITSI